MVDSREHSFLYFTAVHMATMLLPTEVVRVCVFYDTALIPNRRRYSFLTKM